MGSVKEVTDVRQCQVFRVSTSPEPTGNRDSVPAAEAARLDPELLGDGGEKAL
jgi:hypothetical protein